MKGTRKQRSKKIIVTALLALGLFCLNSLSVNGEEGEGIGFSYSNITPENQISDGNYFDLLVKPKMHQTLITEVRNESSEPIKLKVSISDAKTNESGIIEYGPSTLKSVAKNTYQLSQIVKGPTEVKLKKDEVKELAFELKIPDEPFDGVILGGIQLEKVTDQAESEASVSIENKYAYAFSISLREKKTVQPYKLSAGASFYSTKDNLEKVIVAVNNDSQEIVKDMDLTTVITKKGSDKVLTESNEVGMKMAPKSVLEYPIDFPVQEPGLYQTTTTVRANKQEWVWEKEFEIKQSKEKVAKLPTMASKSNIFLVIFLVLVGGGLIFVVIKRRS